MCRALKVVLDDALFRRRRSHVVTVYGSENQVGVLRHGEHPVLEGNTHRLPEGFLRESFLLHLVIAGKADNVLVVRAVVFDIIPFSAAFSRGDR